MRAHPGWSRVFGVALALLLVNLFWSDPLREATGGGAAAFFAFNLLPSAAAVAWILLGGARLRNPNDRGGGTK